MRRRKFIAGMGGVVAWPLMARAQKPGRVPRVAVLMQYPEDDPEGQLRATAFRQELDRLGWAVGTNLQIDFAWGTGNTDWIRSKTTQLIRSAPDVFVANGSAAAMVARQSTTAVPIIFIAGGDPISDGLVGSLAHPGGNATGFTVLEPSLGPKLLELLKEMKPDLSTVALLFSRDNRGNQQSFEATKAVASKFALEVLQISWGSGVEIDTALVEWRQRAGFGLIVPPDPRTNAQRATIIALAARHKFPVIFGLRAAAVEGALISYGVDVPQLFRQAATYVSRVLKGEKPGELPVQLPSKYDLVINLKTAKALGLAIPPKLLFTADEVIE